MFKMEIADDGRVIFFFLSFFAVTDLVFVATHFSKILILIMVFCVCALITLFHKSIQMTGTFIIKRSFQWRKWKYFIFLEHRN